MQEPKYQFQDGRIINRASGQAIPLDEPVFVLRARDVHALPVISAYLEACRHGPPQHRRSIEDVFGRFAEFARTRPERMREPDTSYE